MIIDTEISIKKLPYECINLKFGPKQSFIDFETVQAN